MDSAIHEAAERGDAADVLRILQASPDQVSSRTESNCQPLHLVAERDHFNAALVLVNHGADINAVGYRGETPLHSAARESSPRVARLLVARGADLGAVDDLGSTPLVLAASGLGEQSDEVLGLLLRGGAKIDLMTSVIMRRLDWVRWLLRDDPEAVRKSPQAHLLYQAVLAQDKAIVELLLVHGADPDGTERMGQTPLVAAVSGARDVAIAELLIQHGADVNRRSTGSGSASPLACAVQAGNPAAIELLRRHGASE